MSASFWNDAVPRVFGASSVKKEKKEQPEPVQHVVSFPKDKPVVRGPTSPAPPEKRISPVESASIEIIDH